MRRWREAAQKLANRSIEIKERSRDQVSNRSICRKSGETLQVKFAWIKGAMPANFPHSPCAPDWGQFSHCGIVNNAVAGDADVA